ncbi:MAG: hypothetical protein KGL94_04385 [Acidobacteriota bacterium]|nr:hypothetical protein [Acidobacteriota bacterium]
MPARGRPGQRRAAARRRSLWIDAPGQEAGLDLIQRLRPLRAEVAPDRDGHCRIGVEATGRDRDAVVIRALAVLLDWAREHGIAVTRLELDGRAVVVAL